MFEQLIGKRSKKVKNVIERGAVKKFAEAIGDPHPIYLDEAVGKQSRYQQNIAPPTFPRVFEYEQIEGLQLPSKGLIHGEQSFHYSRPILVGEEIYCSVEVKNYYERAGSTGKMGFLVLERYGEDQEGTIVFSSKEIIIISESVRKVMIT